MGGGGGVHVFGGGGVAKFQVAKLLYVKNYLLINFWFILLDLHIHIISVIVHISVCFYCLVLYSFSSLISFLSFEAKKTPTKRQPKVSYDF